MHQTPDTPPAHPAEPATPPDRRNLLQWLSYLLGALASLAVGLPVIGYFLGPVFHKAPDDWVDLGPVKDFPEKQTRLVTFDNPGTQPWDGQTKKAAAYVRRTGAQELQVFAVNCAHLGCPVNWFPQSGLFLCPCHGGVYYEDGQRASGPPPRGLYSYEYQIPDEGKFKGHLQIWAGHLPTLQDTLEVSRKKGNV